MCVCVYTDFDITNNAANFIHIICNIRTFSLTCAIHLVQTHTHIYTYKRTHRVRGASAAAARGMAAPPPARTWHSSYTGSFLYVCSTNLCTHTHTHTRTHTYTCYAELLLPLQEALQPLHPPRTWHSSYIGSARQRPSSPTFLLSSQVGHTKTNS